MTAKWLISDDEEYWDGVCEYDTKQEAIDDAPAELGLEKGDRFLVGQPGVWEPKVEARCVIDQEQERAYEEIDGVYVREKTDDYLKDIPQADLEDLEKKLTAIFKQWIAQTNQKAKFFPVINVSEHQV